MRIVYFIILFTFVCNYAKNQGLTNSLANISHENLLDNPWFTVNQRGQSSYSSAYTVDRWKIGYGDAICNVTNDGITLSSSILGSNFVQFIEEDFYNKFIAGKNLTVSVLLTDGTIKSATGYAPVNTSYYQNAAFMYITNTCTLTVVGKTGENEQVQLRFTEANSDSVSIRAIKLELGSLSTLSMDTAPNYQQELAKCQRYYEKNNWYSWYVQANYDGFINLMTSYPFLVKKRVNNITTNILKQNIGNGQLIDLTTSTIIPSSEVTINQPMAYNSRMECVKITHNSIISGHTYYFSIGDDCIAFSADL